MSDSVVVAALFCATILAVALLVFVHSIYDTWRQRPH